MKTVGAACAAFTFAVVLLMIVAWLVMLLVGIWHGIRPAVPPIGYGEAIVLTALGRALTASPGSA